MTNHYKILKNKKNKKSKPQKPAWKKALAMIIVLIIVLAVLYFSFARYKLAYTAFGDENYGKAATMLTPELISGLTSILG